MTNGPAFVTNAGAPGAAERGDPEFISVPEWGRRVGCSMDAAYRAARTNRIPGLFRIGRLMLNWPAFVEATRAAVPIGGDDDELSGDKGFGAGSGVSARPTVFARRFPGTTHRGVQPEPPH